MTQEKMRKVITACVSAATVLIVFLLSFLIYQGISMAILDKKIAKAQGEVAYWTERVETAENDLDYYESEFYLNWALQELNALQGKK
ncbi:MAG: hypothetical protein IJX75_00575 [Clostridia bacterium]|nr:hypothetical protein [Clostridia bacterium]